MGRKKNTRPQINISFFSLVVHPLAISAELYHSLFIFPYTHISARVVVVPNFLRKKNFRQSSSSVHCLTYTYLFGKTPKNIFFKFCPRMVGSMWLSVCLAFPGVSAIQSSAVPGSVNCVERTEWERGRMLTQAANREFKPIEGISAVVPNTLLLVEWSVTAVVVLFYIDGDEHKTTSSVKDSPSCNNVVVRLAGREWHRQKAEDEKKILAKEELDYLFIHCC